MDRLEVFVLLEEGGGDVLLDLARFYGGVGEGVDEFEILVGFDFLKGVLFGKALERWEGCGEGGVVVIVLD